MATPAGGSPIDPGIVKRVANGLRYIWTGSTQWFGPQAPLPPQAPAEVRGRQRDFPVGVNIQARPRTEGGEAGAAGITFDVLRQVAEPSMGGLDLVRIAIETRKDQLEAQRWTIKPRERKDGGDRVKQIMRRLRTPDLVHSTRQWSRMLWEDLLVLDAPCIYLRPMPDGTKLPEVMDGATIKRLVDFNGRTPFPPAPAYQQHLKGLPAVDFTLEELIYRPRNLRSNRLYGFGPVEQIVNIINLGLRRQTHLTGYYTQGNVPEHLLGVPEQWNADQIKAMQTWMDAILEGNAEARRKLFFIPGGMEPYALKDPKLADPLDEWVARLVCWVFSLSPQALVKEVNRATAETSAETAKEEGLEPLKEWWKEVMDEVLIRCFDAEDLEFAWNDEEISDAAVKAQVLVSLVGAGIMDPNEARDAYGLGEREQAAKPEADETDPNADPNAPPTNGKPLASGAKPTGAEPIQDKAMNGAQVTALMEIVAEITGGQIPLEAGKAIITASFPLLTPMQVDAITAPLKNFKPEEKEPPANLVPPSEPGDPGPGGTPGAAPAGGSASARKLPPASPSDPKAVAKAVMDELRKAKGLKPLKRNRAAVRTAEKAITAALNTYQGKLKARLQRAIRGRGVGKFQKMDVHDYLDLWDSVLSRDDQQKLASALVKVYEDLGEDAVEAAIGQIEAWLPDSTDVEELVKQANEAAVKWANERAGELVGMKQDEEGNWVENPNPRWSIDSTTRDSIQSLVEKAEAEGWSNDQLADAIGDAAAFDPSRSMMVARTETAFADVQGNLEAYRASGVVAGKEWLISPDEVCPECEALDGKVVGMDEAFPGEGGDGPPLHPNCRCDVLPVLSEESDMAAFHQPRITKRT